MFYRDVIGRNGRFLGRIAVRDDIDEEMPPTPCLLSRIGSPSISESVILRHRAQIPIAYSIEPDGPLREIAAPTRPVSWSEADHNLLQQWRGVPTEPPRSIDQQRVHGDQPQNAVPGSDASFNNPEKPLSSNKMSLDVVAHLKYLVRGFLRQVHGTASATNDRKKKLPNKECFIPSPKITFLIDKPDNLVCQICRQARLKLAVTAENPEPETTTILPCGHIACYACINHWFERHASCPFCRVGLTHKRCGHKVRPRLLAQDTIHTLPETLANQGKIGDKCFKCAEKERREMSIERWTELADEFKRARREAERLGTDEAIQKMRKARKAFEQLPEDDFWILSRMTCHRW
ncbi:hypothetical protein GGR51DRAFT_341570 [Nemania sp. FL0031]|nr:hypothetical protein GGR51DRAFT_341570 [Nemania sp. FL0031]